MKEVIYMGIDPFTTIWFFGFFSPTFIKWDDTVHCPKAGGYDNEFLIAIFKIKWKK